MHCAPRTHSGNFVLHEITDKKAFPKIWYRFERLRLSVWKGNGISSNSSGYPFEKMSSFQTARVTRLKKIVIRSNGSSYPFKTIITRATVPSLWGLYKPQRDLAWNVTGSNLLTKSLTLHASRWTATRLLHVQNTRLALAAFPAEKTWVVCAEFDLELNFLLLPYRKSCFFFKVHENVIYCKKYQTNILICLLPQINR